MVAHIVPNLLQYLINVMSSKASRLTPEINLERLAEIYRGLGETTLPKGYWIAHVDVKDAKGYEDYRNAIAAPLSKFGAKFLIRGGSQEVPEGSCKARTVLIEFPNLTAAKLCYESHEYQEAKTIRNKYSVADVIIVEGH